MPKFSTHTSAVRSMSFSSASSACDFRFTVIERLLALKTWKIVRIMVRHAGTQPPSRVAQVRGLDLHDIGAKPAERLGAGRPRFELGEIDDLHAGEQCYLSG